MTSRGPILAALCFSAAIARPSQSAPADQERIERGIELRRHGKDAEALEEFRRAYELQPTARAQAQMALAEQALGRWVEAERDLADALKKQDDPWIQKNQNALRAGLEEIAQHLASLQVEVDVPSAEVWIDGQFSASVPPGSLRVPAGNLRLELRAPGHPTLHRAIDLPSGATVILQAQMAQAISESKGAGTPRAPSPTTTATPRTSIRPTLAWAALTATGILLTEAAASEIVRAALLGKYNDASCDDAVGLTRSQRCGRYLGSADTARTFATIGFAVGGATALASSYFFLSAPRTSQISASAGPDVATVHWRVCF
jgi:hypothetical protein